MVSTLQFDLAPASSLSLPYESALIMNEKRELFVTNGKDYRLLPTLCLCSNIAHAFFSVLLAVDQRIDNMQFYLTVCPKCCQCQT